LVGVKGRWAEGGKKLNNLEMLSLGEGEAWVVGKKLTEPKRDQSSAKL